MNIEYNGKLSCVGCGKECHLESHHDESHIRCMYCFRESLGTSQDLLLPNRHLVENTRPRVGALLLHQTLLELNQSYKMN